ncbi:bifunctional ADP-dependent NAD(P)H-hydrate dehydratase/NAD(P)H-hydrate epimerase [Kamptonema formosum]|uniref:bifunctional ADP-dependent NAD(P)H-hydrate dehydratase/NAD(P)H-hydrate epimerase n=1 Tax=Kamptonema formosum TaxID=331992 RepID=UPI0003477EB7|nr:bifunctional ADP-dependent NAD(P)H-hydrate dehydratase/NAD(P)H-hydrate epimerase [Oscillatoria sp. PCC 10802]
MGRIQDRVEQIHQFAVTAEQMRAIEGRVFEAGMPVPALMEKVAGLVAKRIQELYRQPVRAGVLVGPGHNGGDALVVARELHWRGFEVAVYSPFSKLKELTGQHARYVASLGIPFYQEVEPLQGCDLLVDGLFGFGLERSLDGAVAAAIDEVNRWGVPVLSVDIPSGLHTDTGEVLGTAIRAARTFCLGLWKLAFLQDGALEYIGEAELVDFDLPLADIRAVLGEPPAIRRITPAVALSHLPIPRPPASHKYKMGHLLLVCGSRKYTGAAILAGLGARASGVGMLSVAVPESVKPLLSLQLPEALIVGCPETEAGAIAGLPPGADLNSYSAIACGPGLTVGAAPVVEAVLESSPPLVLDADGLNVLAHLGAIATLTERRAPAVLTPHLGEFKRLFPEDTLTPNPSPIEGEGRYGGRIAAVRAAAMQTGAVVLLKGARTAVAHPDGTVWVQPESTPALARGGSGDVLTGLMGGLWAQAAVAEKPVEDSCKLAVWWHASAGILAAQERSQLGVDAFTLAQYLVPVLRNYAK